MTKVTKPYILLHCILEQDPSFFLDHIVINVVSFPFLYFFSVSETHNRMSYVDYE